MSRHADCCFGSAPKAGSGAPHQRLGVELEHDRAAGELVGLAPARMQLADEADARAVELDRGAAARDAAPGAAPATKRAAVRREQGFEIALDVEEVDRALGDAPLQRLAGP